MRPGDLDETRAFSKRQPPPWSRPQGLAAVVAEWKSKPFGQSFVLDELLPAKEPELAPLPPDLDPAIVHALKSRGIERIFSHQARALEAARRGADVVVATPTASGKSLAYNLPVL